MFKRAITILTIFMLIISLFSVTAFAATHDILDGESLDVSTGVLTKVDGSTVTLTINDGDTISVAANSSATITGSKNVLLSCGSGVNLKLDAFETDLSGVADVCSLSFLGTGNTLEFLNTSTLNSGANEPGIKVQEGTELLISGSGTLNALGGDGGAGIGGGDSNGCGSVEIAGGTVNATGGNGGAGIGGGNDGHGGKITISGGTVVAYSNGYGAGIGGGEDGVGCGSGENDKILISGGHVTASSYDEAAGIGGGYDSSGGVIEITGGTVIATSAPYGAGIGGGTYGDGGKITISGGTVTAIGVEYGAGIGGGDDGDGGTIKITGGTVNATGGKDGAGIGGGDEGGIGSVEITGGAVFATLGEDALHDIGNGYEYDGPVGTLKISGTAAVFLKNDLCITPDTSHTHFAIGGPGGNVHGIAVPTEWTDFGVYMKFYTLDYDINGGTGSLPSTITQLAGTSTTVHDGSGLTNDEGKQFKGWNTEADGSGTSYTSASEHVFLANTMFYAMWEFENPQTGDSNCLMGSVLIAGALVALIAVLLIIKTKAVNR